MLVISKNSVINLNQCVFLRVSGATVCAGTISNTHTLATLDSKNDVETLFNAITDAWATGALVFEIKEWCNAHGIEVM